MADRYDFAGLQPDIPHRDFRNAGQVHEKTRMAPDDSVLLHIRKAFRRMVYGPAVIRKMKIQLSSAAFNVQKAVGSYGKHRGDADDADLQHDKCVKKFLHRDGRDLRETEQNVRQNVVFNRIVYDQDAGLRAGLAPQMF